MIAVSGLRAVRCSVAFALLVIAFIASITHGDIQEFCATGVYVGAVLCAVLLAVEGIVERRRGGHAN